MARKKKKAELATSSWLDTYADTITLIMTFFVLMYSMSTIDQAKLQQISSALNQILTGNSGESMLQYNIYDGEVPLVGGETKVEITPEEISPEQATYNEIKSFVDKNSLNDVVSIVFDERGVILQLKDSILFEKGKADLKDESLAILDKINTLIAELPNTIIIEGHTDNIPINTLEFPSNWELSGDRASRVLRYFTEVKGQNPSRFTYQGCGETKPLVENNSEENKAINRRVNILIVAKNKE